MFACFRLQINSSHLDASPVLLYSPPFLQVVFALTETPVGLGHRTADIHWFKHRSTWGWRECHKEMIVKIPVFQARLFLFPFFFFPPYSGPCKTSVPFLPHPVCSCAALSLDITASLMTQIHSSQREMLKWECHDRLTTNATIIHR